MRRHVSPEILTSFKDALGNVREAPADTVAAIESAMGTPPDVENAVMVVRRGEQRALPARAEIELEGGTSLVADDRLRADLPLGYHTLRLADANQVTKLIVTPGVCHLPKNLSVWGWSTQLYATRSSRSWGMGDLADLRQLGRWSARDLGAKILLVNPLQATLPIVPQERSPYFPSSRQFLNPLYLRIEEISGAAATGSDLETLAAAGEELNRERQIDPDAVFKLKKDALGKLWTEFSVDASFERFCRKKGEALTLFATFCALAEHHGSGWHKWPEDYRNPHSPAVARFAEDHANRVDFFRWLQWLLDEQLRRAAAEIPLMQDLPIGVDPDGADAWAWQDVFAGTVAVGSPPDEFNTQGQNWGLPPFVPWKLRAAGYEPFIQTVRGALRHAGGLRIDHVMGLFRLYWIPKGIDPSNGAYVRYREDELLGILALESERAKAYVVGEDLGTVEESAREKLAAARVLSYRLLWFEKNHPRKYPKGALAAVTTHDLPTVRGLWTGSDLSTQKRFGLEPNEKGTVEIRDRLRSTTGLSEDAPVDEVIRRAYRLLAEAPCAIVSATLDDALAVDERPNWPGAAEHSWSLALPRSLEELQTNPLAWDIAEALRTRRKPRKAAGKRQAKGESRVKNFPARRNRSEGGENSQP
jgi:4-alpha-glucanotransferase